jgi:hypothetical protein
MGRQRLFCLVVTALAAAGIIAAADDERPPTKDDDPWLTDFKPPRGYVAYRAAKPLVIDGKLDDEAWQAAPWSDDFVDIEGDRKPKPTYRTRMKMLWDDKYLYIGAELEEPHVWATLTKHDSYIFAEDNDFEIFLDPDGDSHLYGELEINALNTTWDLLLTRPYKDGGRAIDAWEITGLKTAIHVDGTLNDARDKDKGWTIEIAWPWDVLRQLGGTVPPKDGDQMRINFSRVQWEHEVVDGKYRKVKGKPENNWVWSPQWVIDMHRPERWGYVQFSTAKPGEGKFQTDPTGPARHALHRVYYAQKAYQKEHGGWAKSLDQLKLGKLTGDEIKEAPLLEAAGDFYQVSATTRQGKRVNIREDGRVWVK